jgi:hypothetical protein
MRSASEARGTHPQRVGNDVGVDVGNDVGAAGSPAGGVSRVARCVEQGCGACQRSSTRRRRVPSPPPTVAGGAWSGQAVKGEWHAGFDLQLLNLESDTLASLLGYAMPPAQSVGGVLDAVRADPRLDTAGRELLTSVYRWLVRRRSVGDGRS